jgi:DNA-binding CsgD family transcriptional regulator
VSPATVRNHVQNILHKLDAHSRLEAVAHARRCRLI